MSPVAIATELKCRKTNHPRKGTGHRRTEYKNPSMRVMIEQAPDIDALSYVRKQIILGLLTDQLEPSDKTEREWAETLWKRVIALMVEAKDARSLNYVYNVVHTWPKPRHVDVMLYPLFLALVKPLPYEFN